VSNLVVEFTLFLCSYAPLFAILAIRFEPIWLTLFCSAVATAGIVGGLTVLRRFRRVEAESWPLSAVTDRGAEVAGYLASYLLPLVSVPEPSVRDLIAYGVFITVTGVLYIKSGLVRVNPTLYVLGWRLQEVQIGSGSWSGYVLSQRRIAADESLRGVRLTDRLYIEYRR
jgi:hypothetical protein